MPLTFDEDTHTYAQEGRDLVSVTRVLRAVGLIDTTYYDEAGAQRGHVVHKTLELLDRGDLDESTVDPRLDGYIRAWERAKRELRFNVTHVEERLAHAGLGYAGTIDRIGEMPGSPWVVVDIKTGSMPRWVRFQTAAYAMLAEAGRLGTFFRRFGILLEDDGHYRVRECRERTDYDVWKGALLVFKAQKGEVE